MRRTAVTMLVTAATLAAPADAGAATPDLQVLSAQPSADSVPVGVATTVTWVLNVRNNGEATTANTGSIGPVGGAGTFTTTRLKANNPGQDPDGGGYCDDPGRDAPRCRLPFLAASQTQVVEVTDTVRPTAIGTVTRTFSADVEPPDSEGTAANNRLTVMLNVVPGPPLGISALTVRGRSALTAAQRRRAAAKVTFTMSRAADLLLTVERRGADGRFRYYGEWVRQGRAGRQTLLLPNRIGYRRDPPIDFRLRRMVAGSYRLSVVANDGEHTSRTVRRGFAVQPRRSKARAG